MTDTRGSGGTNWTVSGVLSMLARGVSLVVASVISITGYALYTGGDAPDTPDAGKVAVYAKADGRLYIKNDAGEEQDVFTADILKTAGGDTYAVEAMPDNGMLVREGANVRGTTTVNAQITFDAGLKLNTSDALTLGTSNSATLLHNNTDLLLTTTTGDVIVTPAGGDLIVRQPGGVAGTDDLVLRHDGTDGNVRALSGSLHLLDNGGTSRLNITSGGSLRFSVTAQPNNSTVDFGVSGNGFRGLHLKEDGSSGVHWGNDGDVRAWFDEATTDNFFLTSSKGDFVFEPGGGQVYIRQSGGVAGTDDLLLEHDGTNANLRSLSGSMLLKRSSDGVDMLDINTSFVRVLHVLRQNVSVTVTASTTQTQGNGALSASVNFVRVTTCANANDTVTLPAALSGVCLFVANDGAQTLQIFPASGDDLGSGTNTATTLAAGGRAIFMGVDGDTWVRGW